MSFNKLVIATVAMGISQFFLSEFALSMGQVSLATTLAYSAFYFPPAFFIIMCLVLAFIPSKPDKK